MLRAEAPAGAPPCRIHVVTPEAPDGGKGCVGLLDTDKQNLYATHYWLDHVLRPMQRRFLWPNPATADLIFLNASFRCRVPRPLTLHLHPIDSDARRHSSGTVTRSATAATSCC